MIADKVEISKIEKEYEELKLRKDIPFVCPTRDFVIKTIVALGDVYARECIYDVLSYVLDRPFVGYELVYNEDGKLNYEFIANRMDLHFLNKEREEHVIVEINDQRTDTYVRKNMSELYKLAGNYYGYNNRERYKRDIQVRLINLNNFHHLKGKYPLDFRIETSPVTGEVFDFIRVYDLFIPYFKEVCYNDEEADIEKTIAMLQASSYEEMEELASDSIKRKALYNMVKKMGDDPLYMPLYDREAFRKAEREELEEKATKEGLEKGFKQGIEQGIIQGISQNQEENARRMLKKGYPLEDIAEITGLSLESINSLADGKYSDS